MARSSSVQVKGLRELGDTFGQMEEKMQKEIARAATGVAAGNVADVARAKVPVRTGLLKSQIITKRLTPSQAQSEGATSVHLVTVRQGRSRRKGKKDLGSAPHAHLVELGTVHMAPQPFLRPALDENVTTSVDLMASVLRKKLGLK